MPYKCVTLAGLVMQALAALPPAWVVWHPEQWSFSSEFGTPVQTIEILSKRDKRLLGLGLALLFAGTSLQGVSLLIGP